MILFINTSQTDLIQLKLIDKGKIVRQLENKEEFKQSELLLSMIDKLLKKEKLKIKNLKLIVVVSGPGAFSALRLGVATANALAWSLKVPLIELSVDEAGDDEKLIEAIKQKSKKAIKQVFKPVVPRYGKEPNITKSNNQLIK